MTTRTDLAPHADASGRFTFRTASPARRAGLIGLSAVQLGLQLATWVSLARRPKSAINGPKWLWFLASFINFAGPIAYLLGGRKVGH